MKPKREDKDIKPYIITATQETIELIDNLINVVADDLEEIVDLAQEVFIDETKIQEKEK